MNEFSDKRFNKLWNAWGWLAFNRLTPPPKAVLALIEPFRIACPSLKLTTNAAQRHFSLSVFTRFSTYQQTDLGGLCSFQAERVTPVQMAVTQKRADVSIT